MKTVAKIVKNDGTEIMKLTDNVEKDGDLSKLVRKLINEFRKTYPNESLFDSYRFAVDSAK